jgi:hypothetical protein
MRAFRERAFSERVSRQKTPRTQTAERERVARRLRFGARRRRPNRRPANGGLTGRLYRGSFTPDLAAEQKIRRSGRLTFKGDAARRF